MNDIGTKIRDALYCLSPSNTSSVNTKWYLSNGRELSSTDSSFNKLIQVSGAGAIRLHYDKYAYLLDPIRINIRVLSSITAPNVVLRCETPDASGTKQSIYVGIYNLRDG